MTKTSQVILTIIAIVIVIGLILYGFNLKQAANQPIKIAVIGPLTGEAALWGQNVKQGVDVAFAEINKKYPGEFEVIYEDSICDPKTAVNIMNKLINLDGVKYFIGDVCSSATLAMASVAQEKQVVLITAGSSADNITHTGDFIFRVYLKNDQFAKRVSGIVQEKGYRNTAVMYINNDYGQGLKDSFEKYFGIENVVATESNDIDTKDFRTQLLKIKNKNPEIIFLATYYNDGVLIMQQARELGMKIKFIAPDSFDDIRTIELAGDAAEGLIVTTVSSLNGPAQQMFKQAYENMFSTKPVFLSDYSYDAFNLIITAVNNVGDDSMKVKNNLFSLKDFPGASNVINFDQDGEVINPATTVKVVQDGKFINY
jgi:branched-chain amino acid transport system substrate-binding protein